MLDVIRRKQKTTLVQVVFWVIIATFIGTIFLVWGRGGKQSRGMSAAAQVDGADISFDDFKSTYSNMYNFYKRMYGKNFTADMERKIGLSKLAINNLIDQTLLLQEAERQHLSVDKQEIVKAIAAIPAFHVDGNFNRARYLRVLAYQRMKPELFEQIQRRQMLIAKERDKLLSSVNVSDEDVVAEYRRKNEKINLGYLKFTPGQFVKQVKLSEKQIDDYYDANNELFRVPEQIELAFVQLDPKDYIDQVAFNDADIEQYYNRHLSQFDVAEQASVAHILIKVAPNADEKTVAKKKKLAEDIMAKAKKSDFAQLARKYSDDKGSAAKGGELGYFKRGVMVPPFEDAAFALAPGELRLVKTRFGFHILKGIDHIDGGFKPLKDVIEEVKSGLANDLAGRLAYEKAMDAYNINRKEGGIAAAAKQLQATVTRTGLFTRAQIIPDIGKNEELAKRAFSMEKGQLIAPVKTARGIFLCEVADKKASYVPELDKVRPQVEEAVRKIEAVKLAQQAADNALKEVLAGKPFKSQAVSGSSIGETGLFSRAMGGFIPKLGNVKGLSDAGFALTVKNPLADKVFVAGENYYVVRLKQFRPADPKGLTAEESEHLRANVLRAKRDEVLKQELKKLRADAEIVISPAILQSIEGKK